MTSAPIPPWLDINPSENLLKSASVGSEIGSRQRQMADQEAQFGQEMQTKRAQLAAETQAQTQELQFRVGQAANQAKLAQANLQLESQKAAVASEESKMRTSLQWQQAARKFQAQQRYQQTYQQLINSGISPEDAAMQATLTAGPAELGETGTGVAALLKNAKLMASVPEKVDLGEGNFALKYGGSIYFPPKAYVPEDVWQDDTIKSPEGDEIVGQRNVNTKQFQPLYKTQDKAKQTAITNAMNIVKEYQAGSSKYGKLYDRDGSLKKMYLKALKTLGDEGDNTGTDEKDPLGLFSK